MAIVIGVSVIIALSQGGVAYSVLLGARQDRYNVDDQLLSGLQWLIRVGLLVLAVTLWMLKRKRALFRVIIVANAFFTVILLYDVTFLFSVLRGSTSRDAGTLLADVALIAASNMLIFSIWYWIVDPPGVIEDEDADQSWAFLFPPRSSHLPRYESWAPVSRLPVHRVHVQLCVRPYGRDAADSIRKVADDGPGRDIHCDSDRPRRCGDQYPDWQGMTDQGAPRSSSIIRSIASASASRG